MTVYERPRPGSILHEVKASGLVQAAPDVVLRVLDDVNEFPRFMPYVSEARVLSENAGTRIVYQVLAMPLLDARDYVLRVRSESRRSADGTVTCSQTWAAANEFGPTAKKGITRVKEAQGSWLLEGVSDGRTMATYTSFFDPGGSVPAFITNRLSKETMRKLFAALRKQAGLSKYSVPPRQ